MDIKKLEPYQKEELFEDWNNIIKQMKDDVEFIENIPNEKKNIILKTIKIYIDLTREMKEV